VDEQTVRAVDLIDQPAPYERLTQRLSVARPLEGRGYVFILVAAYSPCGGVLGSEPPEQASQPHGVGPRDVKDRRKSPHLR